MKNYLIVALFLLGIGVCNGQSKTARLHGSLKEFQSAVVNMNPGGAAGDISDAGVVKIPVDADGNFDLVLPLDKPGYFQVGRNTLYLTPGDDMEVYLGTSQAQSTFQGKGWEANTYLKKRLFPKAGSFLEAGRNLREPFEATKAIVDSLAQVRAKELKELKGVTAEFKKLEEMRIKADVVNSYMSFASYSDHLFRTCKSDEEYHKIAGEFYNTIRDVVNPLLKEIAAKDDYIDVAVVRDVLLDCYDVQAFTFPKSKRLTELKEALTKGDEFDGELTPAKYEEMKAFGEGLKSRDFSEVFLARLERRAKLMQGRPAIDLDIMTPDGKKGKLSDYKGRVMYVDFWATWCGPCMGEMPYFNELSSKYPNVRFVGVSIDENEKAWKSSISGGEHGNVTEVVCRDSRTKTGWDITGIPRFLLIDENFNIISSEAPRPSQKEVIEPLLTKFNTK